MSIARTLHLVLVILLLSVCQPCKAAEADRSLKNMIIDHTVTLPGHDFYRAFSGHLETMTVSMYFDQVALKEVRSNRSGNTILIEHHQAVVFQTTVYPADRYLEIKAKQAAAVVSGKLSTEQLQGLFPQGGDLAGDEL